MDSHQIDHVLNSRPPNSGENATAYRTRMNTVSEFVEDHASYTRAGMYEQLQLLGMSQSDIIALRNALAATPEAVLLVDALDTGGFNFAKPANRQALEAAAMSIPQLATGIGALLAIGHKPRTPWQVMFGVSASCSADDAAEVVATKAKKSLATAAATRWNTVHDGIMDGTITTIEAAIEAFGE